MHVRLELGHCCTCVGLVCVIAETQTCVGVLLCILWLHDCVVNLMAGWLLRERLILGNNVILPLHLLLIQPDQSMSRRHEVCM